MPNITEKGENLKNPHYLSFGFSFSFIAIRKEELMAGGMS